MSSHTVHCITGLLCHRSTLWSNVKRQRNVPFLLTTLPAGLYAQKEHQQWKLAIYYVLNLCSGRIFFILSKVNNRAKIGASKQDGPLTQRNKNKKANGSNTAHQRFFACLVGLMSSDVKTGVCKLSFVISVAELCDIHRSSCKISITLPEKIKVTLSSLSVYERITCSFMPTWSYIQETN